jgi:FMN reductase
MSRDERPLVTDRGPAQPWDSSGSCTVGWRLSMVTAARLERRSRVRSRSSRQLTRRGRMATSRLTAVGVSGSPGGTTSRSRALLVHALGWFAARGVGTTLIDLALVPADGLLGRTPVAAVQAALDAVADARIVVASTPIYRATYSGLLKVFFDLLPSDALVGKVGVPIATGRAPGHLLAIDHGLRPLFASLGAVVVGTGVYATEKEFRHGAPDPSLLEHLDHCAAQALALATQLFPTQDVAHSLGRKS